MHRAFQIKSPITGDTLTNWLDRYIVTPGDDQDVVKAVQFASDHGLKVSARCTGHQISGIAVPSCGLVIDMTNLNKISLAADLQTAAVQVRDQPCALDTCAGVLLKTCKALTEAVDEERPQSLQRGGCAIAKRPPLGPTHIGLSP